MNYTPDWNAESRKKRSVSEELNSCISGTFGIDAFSISAQILSCMDFSPPMEPPQLMQMLTVADLGKGGGHTRKPGNITIKWKKLWDLAPDAVLTGAGVIGCPWLIPFAVLSITNKLWDASRENISERHALVVYALWSNKDRNDKINEDRGFEIVCQLVQEKKLLTMDIQEYTSILNILSDLHCIRIEGGFVCFTEGVRIKYKC